MLKSYFYKLGQKQQRFISYQPTLIELRKIHWAPMSLSAIRPVLGVTALIVAPGDSSWRTFWTVLAVGSAIEFFFDWLDGSVARKLGVTSDAGGTFDLYCDFAYAAFVLALIGKIWMHDYKFALTTYGSVALYVSLCWKSASFRARYVRYFILLVSTGFALGIAWASWEKNSIARVRLKQPTQHIDPPR